MTNPTPQTPSNPEPQRPVPANDNRPPSPANDNQRPAFRISLPLFGRLGARMIPGLGQILLMQDLKAHNQATPEQLEEQQRQQEQLEEVTPEPATEDVPERGVLEITTAEETPSAAAQPPRSTPQPDPQVDAEQRRRERCFESDEVGIESPLRRETTAEYPAESLFEMLQTRGNTPAQEQRLQSIYNSAGKTADKADAEGLYRQFMSQVALHKGREDMDRAQAPEIAMATDQQAFYAVFEATQNYEASLEAIQVASPNMADLSASEQEDYQQQVQCLVRDQLNTLEMLRDRQQQRCGTGVSEFVWTPPKLPDYRESASHREIQLYAAEFIDLEVSRIPGKPINAVDEYRRQLGETIRTVGRDGISHSQEDCELGQWSNDQRIAAQMYGAGYEREAITAAIEAASPGPADQGDRAKQAYVRDEIEPVLFNPGVQQYRTTLEDWRERYGVPQEIKRFDCLQRIQAAIETHQWRPEHLDRVCPKQLPEPTVPEPPDATENHTVEPEASDIDAAQTQDFDLGLDP